MVISADGQRASLRVSRGSQFHLMQVEGGRVSAEIDAAELVEALSFLVTISNDRALSSVLTGIHTIIRGGRLRLEAADRSRVGLIELEASTDGEAAVIIPAVDMLAAAELCDGRVKLRVPTDGRFAEIVSGGLYVRLSTLAGTYPSISQLPHEFSSSVQVDAANLDRAVRAANILDTNRVVGIQVEGRELTMSAAGEELGEFSVRIPVEADDAFALKVETASLAACPRLGNTLTIYCNTPTTPVMVVSDRSWRYWLSPVFPT